jgi:alpha-glucosidase
VGGGFSKAQPWLPLDVKHVNRSADAQQQQSNSVLNRTRQLIHWRQSHQPLVKGTLEVLDTKDNALCWIREWEGERILVVVNLAASELVLKAPLQLKEPLTGHGFNAQVSDSYITLPPYQVFYSYC